MLTDSKINFAAVLKSNTIQTQFYFVDLQTIRLMKFSALKRHIFVLVSGQAETYSRNIFSENLAKIYIFTCIYTDVGLDFGHLNRTIPGACMVYFKKYLSKALARQEERAKII